MSVVGRIHSVETFGTLDGPGIRYVVFLKGCPLRCIYCHNPDTWETAGGEEMDAATLVEKILPYRPFLRGGGVTLTGGEPLLQYEFAEELIKQLKAEGIHTAVDTSGAIPLAQCRGAVDAADLILLDIKALDPNLCRMICGADGSGAKALLEYCEKTDKPVWLRHVLVPDYTLMPENLAALAQYLKPFRCIRRVELLPFHQMGSYKWEENFILYSLRDKRTPTVEEVEMAREIFRAAGFTVQ